MLKDIKITLMTKEELLGSDKKGFFTPDYQLEVIKKYGIKTYDTNLVKLTGGAIYDTSFSCTKTKGKDNKVVSVADGIIFEEDSTNLELVIRPVLKLPAKVNKLFSESIEHNNLSDFDCIYLGEYPQNLSYDYQEIEKKYIENKLEKTGRIFHINNEICEEYKDSKSGKYIRYNVKNDIYIHRRFEILKGENVWVKVLPVCWLIDNRTDTLVSRWNLLSGVRFNKDGYDGNFEKTEMYDFLSNVIFKDIFQDYLPKKEVEKVEEEVKEENKEEDIILKWIKESLIKVKNIKDDSDKINIVEDLKLLAQLYTEELIKIRSREYSKYGSERNLITLGIIPYYVYIDNEIKREIFEDNKEKEIKEINDTINDLIEKAKLIQNEKIKLDILSEIEELKLSYLKELDTSKRNYERIDFSKPLEKHKDSNGNEYMKYIERLTLKPSRPVLIRELMEKELAISKRIDGELASSNIRSELSNIEIIANEITKR